jgi:hypothetical protein
MLQQVTGSLLHRQPHLHQQVVELSMMIINAVAGAEQHAALVAQCEASG